MGKERVYDTGHENREGLCRIHMSLENPCVPKVLGLVRPKSVRYSTCIVHKVLWSPREALRISRDERGLIGPKS